MKRRNIHDMRTPCLGGARSSSMLASANSTTIPLYYRESLLNKREITLRCVSSSCQHILHLAIICFAGLFFFTSPDYRPAESQPQSPISLDLAPHPVW